MSEVEDSSTVSFDKQSLKLDNAEDAKDIIEAINQHSDSLKTLILSGNTMGIEAGEAIGEVLKNHPELSNALWSDMFTGRSKAVIAPALKNLTKGVILSGAKLVELDLRDNAFGPTGVVGVTDLLGSPCCHTLKILRLDNEGLGHQGCRLVSDALSKCLEESKIAGCKLQLKIFTAGRNRLENEGIKMLSEVFREMKSLEELAVYQNGIGIHGIDGCEALADALSENKELRILNLADNSLTRRGMKILAENVLPHLEKLEILNVSDCILKSSGAQILADSLKDTVPCLKELHASGNEIRRSAGIDLILSLENKQETLRILDLNSNEFGENGITDILEAAASLDLEDCLQSLSDDDGCDDDEDEEEETDEDGEEDEDEDEENGEDEEVEDSLDGDTSQERNGKSTTASFSFKTPDGLGRGKSLFDGLKPCSPATGLGALFANNAAVSTKPNTSLFSSPSKPLPGSTAAQPNNTLFGDVKSSMPDSKPSNEDTTGQSLFGNPSPTKSQGSGLFGNSSPTKPQGSGLFGNSSPTKPLFGCASSMKGPESLNVLGKSASGKPNEPVSLFGTSSGAKPNQPINLFGTPTNKTQDPGSQVDGSKTGGTGGLFANLNFNTPSTSTSFSMFGKSPDTAATSTTSLFKSPDSTTPSSSLFQNPNASAGSAFTGPSSNKETGVNLRPARFVASSMPASDLDINSQIDRLLNDTQPLQETTIKQLASVPSLSDNLKDYLSKNPTCMESAIKKSIESSVCENENTLCQMLLDASFSANPVQATNYLIVELNLIKGESREKRNISKTQGCNVLSAIKTSFSKGIIPAKQAQLISFLFNSGPERQSAQDIRKQNKSDIDSLVTCIQSGISKLKL